MNAKQKKTLIRIIIVSAMSIILNIFEFDTILNIFLWLATYLVISYDVLKKAVKGIINRNVFSENFLMSIATLGAVSLALYTQSQDFFEAIAVMLFYQIGEFFQSYAVSKSRKNIASLMDIRPDYANIEQNGDIVRIHPDQVPVGSIIVVQPGEKVPIDGMVVQGESTINASALTGESLPYDISKGEEIISGCINLTSVLKIRTTKEFGESTVSRILDLVQQAGFRKSKSENFISKFARIYTPCVCYSALALATIIPVINIIFSRPADWSEWIYRALTFLVISCPCALVISIPLSFFAAMGGASKHGILIKGSNFIEAMSKIKTIVFDKTGTLTKGVFQVNGIHHNKLENDILLEYASHAECFSSHPISKSLKSEYRGKIDPSRVKDVQEISGNGIVAKVDGKTVAVGNQRLMQKLGIEYQSCHKTGTIVHIAINNEYAGHIVISDVIKTTAKEAVCRLKKAGISKIVMLTGDSKAVAESVARDLGITHLESELLPLDKVSKVEQLLTQCEGSGKLAFVGDGINDAPVLSRADIGIAMGAMGSDAAIEAADIILMDDDPLKIVKAIKISKKCINIVRQNIVIALGAKFACLILGALGIANMWFAIFADVGVMIIAVLNAIRSLSVKNL